MDYIFVMFLTLILAIIAGPAIRAKLQPAIKLVEVDRLILPGMLLRALMPNLNTLTINGITGVQLDIDGFTFFLSDDGSIIKYWASSSIPGKGITGKWRAAKLDHIAFHTLQQIAANATQYVPPTLSIVGSNQPPAAMLPRPGFNRVEDPNTGDWRYVAI